jgi:hypothetical protein
MLAKYRSLDEEVHYVTFEVSPRVSKLVVSWDVALCSVVDTDQGLRGAYCLHQ